MKHNILFAALFALILASCGTEKSDNRLVILHTNDTHSQIDPGSDGLGGVMRRKAVIDSIRNANDNVLLVDAGDAVQGTLYFYLYGGKVEQEMMNIMGVDARILGNHEFDNGIDSLAKVIAASKAVKISTNYNLKNTPLDSLFVPFQIKEYGGRKIALLGINLNPAGIISKGNYDGLEYLPLVETANAAAEEMRTKYGADKVIAISHIGYNPKGLIGDSILATNSRGIDIIIGGHSHDTIDPSAAAGAARAHLKNLDGKDVLVVQTGKAGRNLGKIEIDLDDLDAMPSYELIKIDSRYDGRVDTTLADALEPYRAGVDSLMTLWIGTSDRTLGDKDTELINYFSDFVFDAGKSLASNVDFAIANKGGLRAPIPAGRFSKGNIINMVPFANYVTVIDVKGSDLEDVFDVMALTDGNGVSKNVAVTYEKDGDDAEAEDIFINGKKLDDNKIYRVATIDYLAKGGDYMTGLTRGNIVAQSKTPVYDDLILYITTGNGAGRPVGGDGKNRWTLIKD